VEDVIQVQDQFYILASTARADERARVLKHGHTFAVFDHYGDVTPVGIGEQGVFHEGTRFLSRLALRIGRVRPLLLSSTVKQSNDLFLIDLTNPDISLDGQVVIPRGTLHVFRTKFLWNGACYERIRISNHGLQALQFALNLRFEADFADIFEVRGAVRPRRGERGPEVIESTSVSIPYVGLDGVLRQTVLELDPAPQELTASHARFDLQLEPQAAQTLSLTLVCEGSATEDHRVGFDEALGAAAGGLPKSREHQCEVHTSNEQFNDWLNRSVADIHMMITDTPSGPYPYGGVPWFSAPFGRDGIVTALEMLWMDPRLARGVLSYLAATQATISDAVHDAEPGKILHESRRGEMAALGEVPFGQYYGSVDATPLFVILAGAYYDRTADAPFAESIWPNVERALQWIDTYGDADGDGFVEYLRRSPKGLVQQGWKDSHDSVFHADGGFAEGPIALCEVQGYVYAARLAASRLAHVLGRHEQSRALARQAEQIRQAFEDRFWSEDLRTYVLALDGAKAPCRVRTSNAGHCLFSGIASKERARAVAETLLAHDSFSGWGVRTVAAVERRYNPMSYHNGSIWPHDNALIAMGLARYGLNERALEILTGLFDASLFMDLHRMPELFCGFKRRVGEGPTLYPVACAPQSWAAAAPFMLLQAGLGMTVDAPRRQLTFRRPMLPESLERIRINRLRVGDSSVDLILERHVHNVGVNVLRRSGDLEIITLS
jgi:glycogen debranching enzyme